MPPTLLLPLNGLTGRTLSGGLGVSPNRSTLHISHPLLGMGLTGPALSGGLGVSPNYLFY